MLELTYDGADITKVLLYFIVLKCLFQNHRLRESYVFDAAAASDDDDNDGNNNNNNNNVLLVLLQRYVQSTILSKPM